MPSGADFGFNKLSNYSNNARRSHLFPSVTLRAPFSREIAALSCDATAHYVFRFL